MTFLKSDAFITSRSTSKPQHLILVHRDFNTQAKHPTQRLENPANKLRIKVPLNHVGNSLIYFYSRN